MTTTKSTGETKAEADSGVPPVEVTPLVTSGATQDVGDPFPIVYGNEGYVSNPVSPDPNPSPKTESKRERRES